MDFCYQSRTVIIICNLKDDGKNGDAIEIWLASMYPNFMWTTVQKRDTQAKSRDAL